MVLSLNGLLFLQGKMECLNELPDTRSEDGSGGDLQTQVPQQTLPHPLLGCPKSGGRDTDGDNPREQNLSEPLQLKTRLVQLS